MIKVIYFDWGHTIAGFAPDRENKINEILAPFDYNWQTFHPIWREFYILRTSGMINDDQLEDYIRKICQKEIPVKEIIDITIDYHSIPKEHIETIKGLKKNYKIGIISNYAQEWIEKIIKDRGMGDLFDGLTISSRIGQRKPNAKIYLAALNLFNIKPQEAILIADEVGEDLVAASGLGIKTIWYDNGSKGWWNDGDDKILEIYKPDAIVKSFAEIPAAMRKLDHN